MNDFLTAIGLLLVIEGLLFAVAPLFIQKRAIDVTKIPEQSLRLMGVVVLCVGVGVVWLIRG